MEALLDETVEIPVSDLQIIRAAINSAYHHTTVVDLAEQYRKLQQRPQASKLTKALENALTLIVTYIDMAAVKEEAEPDE